MRNSRRSFGAAAWRLRFTLLASGGLLSAVLAAGLVRGEVVINEIYYNPVEGDHLEFIELYNSDSSAVDIGGWAFTTGIRHRFGDGTLIPGQGYLVVCPLPRALAERFGLREDEIHAWLGSSLDDGGERLVLVDATGVVVEDLRYDDKHPWDPAADGAGASLERLCAQADPNTPNNWGADAQSGPTPGAPNGSTRCPPPPLPAPRVAINEIYYHPIQDQDATLEFVELTNTTAAAIDLEGYCFSQGIDFCFDAGPHVLAPGGYVVVCRDREEIQSAFDIANAVGNFAGRLANDGERITLVDRLGRLVDSVRYEDSGDWPVGADQLGFSLEKIRSDAPSDDPASWADSGAADRVVEPQWETVELEGQATSSRIFFYIQGPGEFLIDDVSLVDLDNPDANLVPNGGFDGGIEPWDPRGNHSTSRWSRADDGRAIFDDAALHLVSEGRGASSNSVRVQTTQELDRSAKKRYRLSFRYFHISGEIKLIVRLSISTPSRGIYFALGSDRFGVVTPGASNIVRRESLPPFISNISRFPREPDSTTPTWITARVRGGATQVKLMATLPGGEQELEMRDDGASNDGAAGDDVYGVEIPPQPHNTAVIFKIEATSPAGSRLSPPRTDPAEVHGYYVNDNQPDSKLPIYHLLVRGNPRTFTRSLNCSSYVPCSFAHRGDLYHNVFIRARGGSVCNPSTSPKRFLKVKFHRGHEFRAEGFGKVRRMNLQSLWTDKSLIREKMSWDVFEEMANPDFFHYYIRVHANGDYFGLYSAYEHPDARFLARNDLNPDGNLYKATASREERNGTYEKKTNQHIRGMTDLREFLNAMHDARRNELVSFFEENVDGDVMIDYQASQILINNRDYPHKNHFLYHDTARGKWMPITWDIDLTYGKRWDGGFGGVLNDRMDNPGITPWHTTSVRGGGTGNHFNDKFFSQGGTYYRRAYVVRLWDAIHEKYTIETYEDKLAAFRELLFEEQEEDFAAWGRSRPTANDRNAPAEFDPNLDRVRQHIQIRRRYLINYLRTQERFTGEHDRLKVTEVMYNPVGTDEAEFIELWNNSGRAIDISGWTVQGLEATGADGRRIDFVFPEGSQVDDDAVLVVAKNPDVFEARYGPRERVFGPYPGNLNNSGETLRVKDAGTGHPATVDILRYDARSPWPIEPDGFGHSLELVSVHENLDNDRPEAWRSSLRRGGSPGVIHREGEETPLFTRGDCNADQRLNITDAVAVLLYLFRGGGEPPCLESCDVNGSARVGIEDAIFLLHHLFVPGASRIPAPAGEECAPSTPGACAASNCAAP
ncbi:MAG: lamin tail domain-containing protein [Planctomycetota bacterium]|nr:lamin tail domain-containing protein [Planctomycetota bacterium]